MTLFFAFLALAPLATTHDKVPVVSVNPADDSTMPMPIADFGVWTLDDRGRIGYNARGHVTAIPLLWEASMRPIRPGANLSYKVQTSSHRNYDCIAVEEIPNARRDPENNVDLILSILEKQTLKIYHCAEFGQDAGPALSALRESRSDLVKLLLRVHSEARSK